MGKREENKARKREALLAAGAAAFREHGYERAAIEGIAAEAGVARGTFYLYFPDKRALFEAVLDTFSGPLLAALDDAGRAVAAATDRESLVEAWRDMALAVALVAAEHAQAVEIAFREARVPGEAGDAIRVRELAMFARIHAFTRDAASRGLLRVRTPELAGFVVFGAVERLFYEAVRGTDLGDPLTVAAEVLGLFADAIATPTAPGASAERAL